MKLVPLCSPKSENAFSFLVPLQIESALKLARDTCEGLQLEVARNDMETLIKVKLHLEVSVFCSSSILLWRTALNDCGCRQRNCATGK